MMKLTDYGDDRKHPLYQIWKGIVSRCCFPADPNYQDYGGRGVWVCDRWRYSFPAFCEDIGPRPSDVHTIEREFVHGPYDPDNCRWACHAEQARNKRRSIFITMHGRTQVLADWADECGVSRFDAWQAIVVDGRSPHEVLPPACHDHPSHKEAFPEEHDEAQWSSEAAYA